MEPTNGNGDTVAKRTKVAVFTQEEPENKYKKWTAIVWAASGVAITVTVIWIVILLTLRYSDSAEAVDRLTQQNSELLTELNDLREERDVENEGDACYDNFTNRITETSAAFQSAALGVMVPDVLTLSIQDTPEFDGEPTTLEHAIQSIEDVAAFNTAYTEAVNARSDWVTSGRPLPCPVEASQPVEDS
jgi:hypothetical protein